MIHDVIRRIEPAENKALAKQILHRLDGLTKPPGSLGRLEELTVQYCLCRDDEDAAINTMKVFTFAGDHGITEERVTPYPQEVTVQMVINMAQGGAAISVLCRNSGIEYAVVDVGVKEDIPDIEGIILRKTAKGTSNFAKGPAMEEAQCMQAIEAGYMLAKESSHDLFGIGEMGIGNTSSASALYSLILDIPAETTTGSGTGSHGDLLHHKTEVITRAVALHKEEWDGTGFDALCRLGGFEIAGMAGFIFGAAEKRVPVVIDGFISSAAALTAMEMAPAVRDYLIFSHASAEKFHREFLETVSVKPVLDLNMRLGEGTGSALAMQIVKQALNCYHQMATFSSAGVSNAD